MKAGRTLVELATEVERQAKSKKDFIADTRALRFEATKEGIVLKGVNGGMTLRAIAHQQMAKSLGIPKDYYDTMLSHVPKLLAINCNHWLGSEIQLEKYGENKSGHKWGSRKLIRILDGQVRAILSDSYRPLDNLDLAEAVLPKLQQLEANIVSGDVTENRFYLKAVSPKITGMARVGDTLQAGLVISNSEVGQGSLSVSAMDYRLVCLNGMIREQAIRKAHLGRSSKGQDALEDAREFFKDETRKADDRAFFLKVQDAVGSMFDQGRFDLRLNQYREASERKITADPVKVIEVTAKRFSLNDAEKSSVLTHLINGGSLDAWGLANAVTRASQDVESYDRCTELESIGGDIIELSPSEWKTLAA